MATELKLHIGRRHKKSVVTEQFFTSPLKLGMPRTEGERLEIVLMMASAGILKGDSFQYEICCEENTKTFLTEQSYSKIFDTGEGGAEKKQNITIEKNASLYYRPCAVIPFANSTFDGDMTVHVNVDSEFAYADIVTAGRVGMGEKFLFRHYRNKVCVLEGESFAWMDHCLLEPDSMELDNMIFFDSYTHMGTFYYYGSPQKEELLLELTAEDNERILWGISKAYKGVCIRILAHSAQDIEETFDKIEEILELKTR